MGMKSLGAGERLLLLSRWWRGLGCDGTVPGGIRSGVVDCDEEGQGDRVGEVCSAGGWKDEILV